MNLYRSGYQYESHMKLIILSVFGNVWHRFSDSYLHSLLSISKVSGV